MQNPRLIVLGLLKMNLNYGWEMEDFVKKSNMRTWAKIGMSTIYKTLNQLVSENVVKKKLKENKHGPNRIYYELMDSGESVFLHLLEDALCSNESIYSDRIPALIFAPLVGGKVHSKILNMTERYESLIEELTRWKSVNNDEIADVVIDFYQAVYEAEQKASHRIMALIAEH